MNYVHLCGGWTGSPIEWDPHEAIREEGGYDRDIRQIGDDDLDALAKRVRDITLEEEAEDETETGVDLPWREVE